MTTKTQIREGKVIITESDFYEFLSLLFMEAFIFLPLSFQKQVWSSGFRDTEH